MSNDNYEGSVRVLQDINDVKSPVIGKFTGRQCIYLLVSAALAGLSAFLIFVVLGCKDTSLIVIPTLCAAPTLVWGFIQPGGLYMGDWLMIWTSNHLKSTPVRKLYADNLYDRVRKPEGKEKKKKRKKRKKLQYPMQF